MRGRSSIRRLPRRTWTIDVAQGTSIVHEPIHGALVDDRPRVYLLPT